MKFNKNEFGWSAKNESSSSGGGGLTTAQENKLNIAYNHSKEEHFSGDYNDLTNKPTNISEFNNDANYASETYVNDKIDEAQLGGDSGTIDLSGYVTKETGNANQITFNDGQTFQDKLDNGTLKGDKGDIGVQGIQGERGLKGEKGDKGVDGLTTSISLNGVTYTQENGVITLPNITSGGNIPSVTQTEPQELDMPKVFFYGTALPTTKDNVNLTMDYVSNTDKFSSYVKLKCQGTSSMSYAKKNFTVAMYSDEARATKLKKDFKGWGAQSKFCLKANYVDTTHTRNISGARIGYDMVASRPDSAFKQQLLTAPRYGLVDGFPIKLYFNGEFYGIYTWNIPKDGWMFNMDSGNPNHVVLCAERNTDGNANAINSCQFRKLWTDGDGGDWSVEFGTYSTDMVASFNRCINFVMTATDQEFHDNIGEYFDLYSLLDYYCFSYLVCHLDGLAKNMLMATYDGVIWGACLYDMDSIYGVHWNGNSYVATNYQCPEQYQEQFSLLWQRIERCFGTELYIRYRELRQGALSLTNIVKHVEEIYDVIPDRVFADEKAKWTSLPQVNTNTMTRFRNYMKDRAVYVDAQMEEIGTKVPCTGIVLGADTLSFTTTDTQALEVVVSPSNTTDTIVWSVSPSGIVTVDNGVVTPLTNGTCTITVTCGSQSATCNVTVALPSVECTGITLNKNELVISSSTSEQPSEETIDITQNVTNGSLIRGAWAIGANGGISSFGNVKTNAGDRATDFIPFTSNNTLTISQPQSTYGCGLVAYDSNKQAIACYTTNNTWEAGNTQSDVDVKSLTVEVIAPPSNTAYVRICFNLTNLSNVTVIKKSIGTVVSSHQLTATVTPENCTDAVIWSVEPSGIVTVEDGLVTPIANGECTITATCGSYSDTCAVTVSLSNVECTGISLNQDTLALGASESTSEKVNLLSGINSTISENVIFDAITLEAGGYEICNINGGTFTWLGYTINGRKLEPNRNSTDSVTFRITETADVIISAFPNNSATNTADKLALYKYTLGTSQQFTQAGTGYFDRTSGNIIASSNDVYSETISLDTTKQYILVYNGLNTLQSGRLCMKLNNTVDINGTDIANGQVIRIIKNTSTIAISINTNSGSLSDVQLIEMEKVEGTTSTISTKLTATVTPENCIQPVVWSVSPEGIVTVDNGLVTAVANGECTITATCGSYSDTCAVTVSGMSESGGDTDIYATAEYAITEPRTFNGTSDYIDTGIKLFDTAKTFTLFIDYTTATPTSNRQATIFHCIHEASPYRGLCIMKNANDASYFIGGQAGGQNSYATDIPTTGKYLISFVDGVINEIVTVDNSGDLVHSATDIGANNPYVQISENLLIGCYQNTSGTKGRFWSGTINKFGVWYRQLTEAEINQVFGKSGGGADISDGYMSYMIQYQSEQACAFVLHTASTSTDCQGFECRPSFKGFAFPTNVNDMDTSYMICDSMPTVSDSEKKVNNIPCIAGAIDGNVNYLTVKVLKANASTTDEFKTYFRENPTYIKIKPKDTVHKYSIDINNIEILNTSHTNSGYTCGEFIVNDFPTTNYTSSNVFMSNLGHSVDWSNTRDWSYFKISEWQGNVYIGFQIRNELLETQDLEGIRKYIAKDPNIYYIN